MHSGGYAECTGWIETGTKVPFTLLHEYHISVRDGIRKIPNSGIDAVRLVNTMVTFRGDQSMEPANSKRAWRLNKTDLTAVIITVVIVLAVNAVMLVILF